MLSSVQLTLSVQKAFLAAAACAHVEERANYCEWTAREILVDQLERTLRREISWRHARPREDWRRLELKAVHRAACAFAAKNSLVSPTFSEVERCEWQNRHSGLSPYSWVDVFARRLTRLYGA